MKLKMFKLNSAVEDTVSGLKGTVTLAQIDMEKVIIYLVQPKGLTSSGEINEAKWFVGARLSGKETEEKDVPFEILGTVVRDKITGFRGIATSLVYHVSGCLHVQFASRETKKAPSTAYDFSVLRLEGEAIRKMNETEKKVEMKKRPSPSAFCSSIR